MRPRRTTAARSPTAAPATGRIIIHNSQAISQSPLIHQARVVVAAMATTDATIVLRSMEDNLFAPRPPCIIVERSEEHTSELQSRENLVCRLLLEKKKDEKQNLRVVRHTPQ